MLSTAKRIDAVHPDTVSTVDAARAAGITYRQIWYWIAMKAIEPEYGTGGSGNPYRFTKLQAEHLIQIGHLYRLLKRLGGIETTTEFIGQVWDSLEATGTYCYTDGPLVITLPWPPDSDIDEGA